MADGTDLYILFNFGIIIIIIYIKSKFYQIEKASKLFSFSLCFQVHIPCMCRGDLFSRKFYFIHLLVIFKLSFFFSSNRSCLVVITARQYQYMFYLDRF